MYKETYYAIFANLGMAVLTYLAFRYGYVMEAWNNDIAFIIPAIIAVFLFGFFMVWREAKYTRWCSESVVILGLLGTALGILTAFTAVDPNEITDSSKIAGVVAQMMNGLGAALWTTITGAFASVWLSVNIAILTRDYED